MKKKFLILLLIPILLISAYAVSTFAFQKITVYYIPGGSWVQNDTDEPLQVALTNAGYNFVQLNYSVYPSATFPTPLLELEKQIKPNSFLIGESAGGELAALIGLNNSFHLRGLILLFSPSNLTFVSASLQKYVNQEFPNQTEIFNGSPINFVNKNAPPTLIIHGTNDTLVPDTQSIAFANALNKTGAVANLILIPGGNHGLSNIPSGEMESDILGWMQSH